MDNGILYNINMLIEAISSLEIHKKARRATDRLFRLQSKQIDSPLTVVKRLKKIREVERKMTNSQPFPPIDTISAKSNNANNPHPYRIKTPNTWGKDW